MIAHLTIGTIEITFVSGTLRIEGDDMFGLISRVL